MIQPTPQIDPFLLEVEQPLKQLLREFVRRNIDYERWDMIRRAQMADTYYRGQQYQYLQETNGVWGVGNGVSESTFRAALGLREDEDLPRTLDYCLNLIKGDTDTIVGIISRMKPHCKAQADWDDLPGIQFRLKTADDVARFLDKTMNLESVIQRLAQSLCKYPGASFIYTPYVIDPDQFGETEIPQMRERQVALPAHYECSECGAQTFPESFTGPGGTLLEPICSECGKPLRPEEWVPDGTITVPEVSGVIKTPNGMAQVIAANVLTVGSPLEGSSVKDSDWHFREYEESVARLRQENPAFADKIEPQRYGMNGNSAGENLIRSQIAAPSGRRTQIQSSATSTKTVYWLDPRMYEYFRDVGKRELKEQFLERYPNGLRASFVGEMLVGLANENKKDVWREIKPTEGDYLNSSPPIMQPYFEVQDIINDTINQVEQVIATSSPQTVVSPAVLDYNAIINGAYGGSGAKILVSKTDTDLRNKIHDLPISQPNMTAIEFIRFLIQMAREIVGTPPTLAGSVETDVARVAVIAREQALQKHQPLYTAIRRGISAGKQNAAMQLANWSEGKLYLPKAPNGKVHTIEMRGLPDLLEGGWHYTADETIPISAADERARLEQFLANPQNAQPLGFADPNNADRVAAMIGIPDWDVPNKDAVDALDMEIDRIFRGEGGPSLIKVVDPMVAQTRYRKRLLDQNGQHVMQSDPQAWERVLAAMESYAPPPPPMGPDGGPLPPDGKPPGPPKGDEEASGELPPLSEMPSTPDQASGGVAAAGNMGPIPDGGPGLPPMQMS